MALSPWNILGKIKEAYLGWGETYGFKSAQLLSLIQNYMYICVSLPEEGKENFCHC